MSHFLSTYNNQTIRIPRLQREYVQGSREDIIGPFLDKLLNGDTDLTYIFGYEEDGCFVPVDGQQRLTTLWLLHLYAAAKTRNIEKFKIKITFLSREFADDFCARLVDKLPQMLSEIKPGAFLDEHITSSNWFITSWITNDTVKNILRTLRYIHIKSNDIDMYNFWKKQEQAPNINFSYLNMLAEDGLDDDIYVKMNGRGRPLSVFENLKSWMDENVPSILQTEWRSSMDNKWTDLFWRNRNRNQKNPENIDDEQLFCICNLLLLYWLQHKDDLIENISQLRLNSKYLFEELTDLLDCDEDKKTANDIYGKLCEKWQNGEILHLVWIDKDRLNLMPSSFFDFVFESLNFLSSIFEDVNTLSLYFGTNDDLNETAMYHISMQSGRYDRSLPLLKAILCYKGLQCSLKDWMRTCRNLIRNTEINSNNISKILLSIESFAKEIQSRDIYDYLSNTDADLLLKILSGFDAFQIKEESMKSSLSFVHIRPIMYDLENNHFFNGRISCLFSFLSDNDDNKDELTYDNFKDYSTVVSKIFVSGGEKPIVECLDDHNYWLRRALISFGDFGLWKKGYWCFCNDTADWRKYLNKSASGVVSNSHFQKLLKDVIIPSVRSTGEYSTNSILTSLKSYVQQMSDTYDTELSSSDERSKHAWHFIHHPSTWSYMCTKMAKWEDNNDFYIHLKTSDGNNSNRMDLRTRTIYLDYCPSSVIEINKQAANGWNVWQYERDSTRVCFSIHGKENRLIILGVFHKNTKENDYHFEIHLDEKNLLNKEVDAKRGLNESYFSTYYSGLTDKLGCIINPQTGRYENTISFSRQELMNELNSILPLIKGFN